MNLPQDSTRTRTLVVAALLAAPLAAGAFGATGWSWGWDHLHRVPAAWPLLLTLLAALAFMPACARRFLTLFDRAGDELACHPLTWSAVGAALALAAFLVFPIATRQYGDSQTILTHHAAGDLALHLRRLLEPGVATRGAAVALLHDLCESATGLPYARCYQLLSALCGAGFVFAHLRLAAGLPGLAGWSRAAIVWLGLSDGANQLFFGHIENYAVPRFTAALFLMLVVRELLAPAARPGRRRLLMLLLLALTVTLHLQWLVLLPAALLLLASQARASRHLPASWTDTRLLLVGLGGAVALVVAAYVLTGAWCYDYLYTGGQPEPRQILLPVSTACVGQPWLRYTLLSAPHLADLAGSLWSVSSPAVLLALVLARPSRRRSVGSCLGGVCVPAAAAAAALLHDLVLNPSIGFPFDWDLMCVVSPPLLYTAVLLVALAGRRLPATTGETVAADESAVAVAAPPVWILPLFLLGLATTTVFAVNAGASSSYGRVEDMAVWLHRTYYGSSHYRLNGNLSTIADPQAQDRERVRVLARLEPQVMSDDREVAFLWEKLGRQRAERGQYLDALVAYRAALRCEPSRWTRWKEAGWLETEAGDEAVGLALLDDYLRRAPTDAAAWRHLGFVHARAGRVESARQAWERFLAVAPDSTAAASVRDDLRRLGAVPTP